MRFSNATALNLTPYSTRRFAGHIYSKLYFVLGLTFLLLVSIYGQDNFDNKDFEASSTCDPEDCDDVEISCIDGWWAWGDSNPDLFAWFGYGCTHMPSTFDCINGGLRGIWLQDGDFGDDRNAMTVVTRNPAFGDNPNAVYRIQLDFIPFSSSPPGMIAAVRISGSSFMTGGSLTHLKTTQEPVTDCSNITQSLFFDHGQANSPDPNITTFPYLVFSVVRAPNQAPPGTTSNGDFRGVLDNVSMCKVLEVNIHDDCDLLCVSVDFNEECYESLCDIQDCATALLAINGINTFIEYDHAGPWDDILECAEIPEIYPQIDILFNATNEDLPNEGLPEGFNIRFTHILGECIDYDVTSNTTWNALTVPNDGKFKTLTVKGGYKLIIADDLALHFCEGGSLIIEQRAELELHGMLTSNCPKGWLGVKVYGNKNFNQFADHNINGFHQGRIFLYPGSVVENAITGVELFGPTIEDTGGQIFADGAIFRNNSRGLLFYPYINYILINGLPGKKRPYESSILNCTFSTDHSYMLDLPFSMHIQMIGVEGIPILESDFIQSRLLPEANSIWGFGVGISAVSAGFTVDDIPCTAPCDPDRSTFSGFAFAIYSSRIFENKPFIVNHAVFSNNYYGIVNSFVSGGTMTYNNFIFGSVPNGDVRNDQIGIHVRSDIYPFALNIQENTFTRSGGSIDNAMGIIAENLGSENMTIRRNIFDGVTVGNEAFGTNANNLVFPTKGMHYLCNQNNTGNDKDFYVLDESMYGQNNIRKDQKDIVFDGPFFADAAAGNTFSLTGDIDDGDFANYGNNAINYYYNLVGVHEEPLDYTGFSAKVPARENLCPNKVCPPFCFGPININEEKESYFDNKESFENALINDDTLLASGYKISLDSNLSTIILHTLNDTASINVRDSLRLWLARTDSYAGDLLLAGDYMSTGEYTILEALLDSIPNRYDLTDDQEEELNQISSLYTMLYTKSIFDLDSAAIAQFQLIADRYGTASSLARSVLSLYDINYTPAYYIPGEINPRSRENKLEEQGTKKLFRIFPNPVSTELVIEVDESVKTKTWLTLYTSLGDELLKTPLVLGSNSISLKAIGSGIVFYCITSDGHLLGEGTFVKIE